MNVELAIYMARVRRFAPKHLRIKGLKLLNMFELMAWLSIPPIVAGGVHENPGPVNTCLTTRAQTSVI